MQNSDTPADAASGSTLGLTMRDPASRSPLILSVVWIGLVILTLILTGCAQFSVFYVVYLGGAVAIAAISVILLNALYRRGAVRLFAAYKKFTGYAVLAHYILHCLPRVGWANAGLIPEGREIFIYSLTLVCTAAGILLFIFLSRKKTLVAFGVMTPEESRDPELLKKNRKDKKRGPILYTLEWVDVIAYGIVVVLLVNIFIFQLYVVPSESMVPVFLEGDRPFTLELTASPHLPLTPWRLPFLKQPARGDVILITNPRYPENYKVNLKKYLAQAIFKVTFSLVNIDTTTQGGEAKYDPLVKRIVGVPGEKLMMVDDVLYARTAGQAGFSPVAKDVEQYRQIDLWKLDPKLKIANRLFDSGTRDMLTVWDRRKNETDPTALAAGLAGSWNALELRISSIPPATLAAFNQRELPAADPSLVYLRDQNEGLAPAGAQNVIAAAGVYYADQLPLSLAITRSKTARAALKEYATAGAAAAAGPTAYERGSRALNLLIKGNLIARVDRDIQLISSGAGIRTILEDPARSRLMAEARELNVYLNAFYDVRNFPEFPAGDAFLGPDQYFAMGDNRYNSTDFRMRETPAMRALDPSDPASVRYSSNIAPFALEKRFIDGYATVRVWPPSRIGLIK